jgi:hypothetical protein
MLRSISVVKFCDSESAAYSIRRPSESTCLVHWHVQKAAKRGQETKADFVFRFYCGPSVLNMRLRSISVLQLRNARWTRACPAPRRVGGIFRAIRVYSMPCVLRARRHRDALRRHVRVLSRTGEVQDIELARIIADSSLSSVASPRINAGRRPDTVARQRASIECPSPRPRPRPDARDSCAGADEALSPPFSSLRLPSLQASSRPTLAPESAPPPPARGQRPSQPPPRRANSPTCLAYTHASLAAPSSAPPQHTGPVSSAPGPCDTMLVVIMPINVAGQI